MSGAQAELDNVSGITFILCAANPTFYPRALPAAWFSLSSLLLTSTIALHLTWYFSGMRQQLCSHPRLQIISSSHSFNSDSTSNVQFMCYFRDTCSYSTDLNSQWLISLHSPPWHDHCSAPLSPCSSAGLGGTLLPVHF